MDSTPNIYAEKTALVDVLGKALETDGLENIIEIFKSHSKICIDLTDSERDAIFTPDDFNNIDILLTLFNAFDIEKPIALKSYFEQMEEEEDAVVLHSNSYFLRDCTAIEAEQMREKYGVWVISKDEVSNRLFEYLSFKDEFEPDTYFGENDNGWKNIVEAYNLRLPPSNSMIISDNYLLSNKVRNYVLGLANLSHLLDVIIPKKLSVPYYILILSPAKDYEETQMLQKVSEWKEDLIRSLNRAFDIHIEFVFSPRVIHKRIIYLNYCFIGTEKGFKVFMPFSNRVYRDGDQKNSVWTYTYFHDPLRAGRREHQLAYDDIEKVRIIYKKARENFDNGVNTIGQPKFVDAPIGSIFSPNRIFD